MREKRELDCRCRQNGPLKTGVIEKLAVLYSSSRKRKPPLCMKGMDEKKVKEGDYGFLLPSSTTFPYFHFKRFSLILPPTCAELGQNWLK